MKINNSLFSISLLMASIASNVAYADFFDSARNMTNEVTNNAGNLLKDAAGDWCSGKKYFSDMDLSERLKAGSEDLQQEIAKLNDSSSKMEYDIKFTIEQGVDKVLGGNQDLVKMNNELCTKAKATNYAPVDYSGTSLRDKGEIMAQVRLNLATIRTGNNVTDFYNKQKVEFNHLNDRIKAKANELAVLKKNFDNLSDPRGENKTPSYFESVMGNACTAIGESEDLIMEYDDKNSTELFRNAAQNNQSKTISDAEVADFMDSCSGSDANDQQGLMEKAKSLFGL